MGYVSNVKTVEGYLDDWQNKALWAIGDLIDGHASLLCPVGEYDMGGYAGSGKVGGNLRVNLGFRIDKKKKFVRNGNDADYAIYVEKGTGKFSDESKAKKIPWRFKDDMGVWHTTYGMKAQPFLTPAAEENRAKIFEIVRKVKFANGIK